jgi:tripartite-type tricarboxylate transporter receptor subunit TctC
MMRARVAAAVIATGMMVLGAGPATGQAYPTRPIRIITAPPGGGNDFVARVIAQGLTASLGQQLVVDNRPATVMGELLAKAPPDGYTLLVGGTALWLAPFLQDTVPYDPVKDFAPISFVARSVNLLVVHPSVAANSAAELISLAKAKPGQLNCATGANGSSNHLAAELFKYMAGINIVRIPYKGSGPAVNDLLAGQTHMMFPTTASGMPHVKAGRLRALGVASLKATVLAPGLPPVAETGLPGFESVVMYTIFAPAGTPAPVIKRLHAELAQGLKLPAARDRLFGVGVEVVASTPGELASAVKSEMERMGKIIREARLSGR